MSTETETVKTTTPKIAPVKTQEINAESTAWKQKVYESLIANQILDKNFTGLCQLFIGDEGEKGNKTRMCRKFKLHPIFTSDE